MSGLSGQRHRCGQVGVSWVRHSAARPYDCVSSASVKMSVSRAFDQPLFCKKIIQQGLSWHQWRHVRVMDISMPHGVIHPAMVPSEGCCDITEDATKVRLYQRQLQTFSVVTNFWKVVSTVKELLALLQIYSNWHQPWRYSRLPRTLGRLGVTKIQVFVKGV